MKDYHKKREGAVEDVLEWLFENSPAAIAEFEEARPAEESILDWLTPEASPVEENRVGQVWEWLTDAAERLSVPTAAGSEREDIPSYQEQGAPVHIPVVSFEPRSLRGSLDSDKLEYAELVDEIERIERWLANKPSGPDSDHLRAELKAFHAAELRLIEQREAEGKGPKEGSVEKLISIVHRARLENELGLWPDHKFLTNGIMEWRLEPTERFTEHGESGWTKRRIQVKFTPDPSFGNKTVSFLQTKIQTTRGEGKSSKQPKLDMVPENFSPFYGMDWDVKLKKWIPEGAPKGYKNAPSSAADRTAYLWDEPWAPPGQVKRFETVAVVPETSAMLGALTWSVVDGDAPVECTEKPSASFLSAVERFYSPPTADIELDPRREQRYDVILDDFIPNDATLTAGQEKQLEPIITKIKKNPKWMVSVAGFADAMDKDPVAISEQRAASVVSYLAGKGVAAANLEPTGLGATWARYPPRMKEGRNRRVQVRLFYPPPP